MQYHFWFTYHNQKFLRLQLDLLHYDRDQDQGSNVGITSTVKCNNPNYTFGNQRSDPYVDPSDHYMDPWTSVLTLSHILVRSPLIALCSCSPTANREGPMMVFQSLGIIDNSYPVSNSFWKVRLFLFLQCIVNLVNGNKTLWGRTWVSLHCLLALVL